MLHSFANRSRTFRSIATLVINVLLFGVMLAEMTTGRHPFRQPSTMETFAAVLREPPALGDCPPRMMILLQRLLAKDVEGRYASVS